MMATGSEAGFHEGELAVQRLAGVADAAARLEGMLSPTGIGTGLRRFLADQTFAAMAARDNAGHLWVSPLAGPPGFLQVPDPATLVIHAVPGSGDPLRDLPSGQAVGLVVMDFSTRRRVRVNGRLAAPDRTDPGRLRVMVEQAFGNCPQYIHPRSLILAEQTSPATNAGSRERLNELDELLIRRADTFFVGTSHPTRGADASHRGGPAGFVRVEDGDLLWPDFPGNKMFNTLGNLAVDPRASLLVPDFATGRSVQMSGTATIVWTPSTAHSPSGRLVRFHPELVVGGSLPIRVRPAAWD